MELNACDENSPMVANRNNIEPQFGSPAKQPKKIFGEQTAVSPKQKQQRKAAAKNDATNSFAVPRVTVGLNIPGVVEANNNASATLVVTEAPAMVDGHSDYVKDALNTLVVVDKKAEAVWLSKHVLASFSSDFRCSEADVKANVAAVSRPSVETAVMSALDDACQNGLGADIVVSGAVATRTMTLRALMTLVKDDPKMLSLIANVEQVFSSFVSNALDDPECDRSAGWFQLKLESSTREILALEIHPALLAAPSVFCAPLPKPGRLFNVFHQLLAGGNDNDLKLLNPLERKSQSIGERFSLIRQLGPAAIDNLATMRRTDGFGFNSLIDALSALGFSKEEQTTIWKTCSAVLYLCGDDQKGDAAALEVVSELLSVKLEEMIRTLHSTTDLAAFASQLYQDVYLSIIHRINMKIISMLESRQVPGVPTVTMRLFDCANSATIASVPTSLPGGSMSAVDILRNLRNAFPSMPCEKKMVSLLNVCRQERFVVHTLGSRATFSSSLQASSSLALAGLLRKPWIYSSEVLNARFPNVLTATGNETVCEEDWVTLQAKQLAHTVEEMEQALALSQQASGEYYSELSLSGAVSLVQDVEKMATCIRTLLLRVRDQVALEALLARVENLSGAAKLDRDFRMMLCPIATHLDMEMALRTLRSGLEHPTALSESEFLSTSFYLLKKKLVDQLKAAKEYVDRDVFRQVHAQDKHFARKDLALLTGPDAINQELQDLLEHIFSFHGCSDDVFDKAESSAKTLQAMRSNDSFLKAKVQAELITRFVQQNDGLHDIEPLKQEDHQESTPKQPKESLLKSALQTLQAPMKKFASASKRVSTALPVPLLSMRARKASQHEQSVVVPQNTESPTMKMDDICAGQDFQLRFRAPFASACDAFKQRISEADVLVAKTQLCNAFNYLNDNRYDSLVAQEPFQERVVLAVVDACDSSTWSGQTGLLSKAGLHRLALLAFVSFAFGQYQPRLAAKLMGWLKRQDVPDQAKALLTEFIFGTDSIFQKHPHGSQRRVESYFKPEMLEEIWSRFTLGVPFESKVGTVRKVGRIAKAFAFLASKKDDSASVATSFTVESSLPISNPSSSATYATDIEVEPQDEEEDTDIDPVPETQLTEAEKLMWAREQEWRTEHTICRALYDYADPDGEEGYLSVKAEERLWIPLHPAGKASALSRSRQWIWVVRYAGGDGPIEEGYIPFKFVGYPGFDELPSQQQQQ